MMAMRTAPRLPRHALARVPRYVAPTVVTRSTAMAFDQGLETSHEDFYGILGVDPNAPVRDIRRAYIEMMRSFHPDQYSGTGSELEAANELCTLLNEIYETLSDADKRSTYDALVGYAFGSINPFSDRTQERDQVFVDEVSCIGCAMCVRTCPQTFQLESSFHARARVYKQAVTAQDKEDVAVAIDSCPVDCISYVTLPQLPLLETALSKMGRTSVYVMRRTGKSGPSVFDAAAREWQRRQSAIEAKVREQTSVDWRWWGTMNHDVEDVGAANNRNNQQPTSVESRRIARLAAVAARASRMWRSAGGGKGKKAIAQLE